MYKRHFICSIGPRQLATSPKTQSVHFQQLIEDLLQFRLFNSKSPKVSHSIYYCGGAVSLPPSLSKRAHEKIVPYLPLAEEKNMKN